MSIGINHKENNNNNNKNNNDNYELTNEKEIESKQSRSTFILQVCCIRTEIVIRFGSVSVLLYIEPKTRSRHSCV